MIIPTFADCEQCQENENALLAGWLELMALEAS